MKVFLLFHEYTDEDHDDAKLLGVFSARQNAEEALKKYLDLPGFRIWPDGFTIDEYTVDKTHWIEGFSYPDPKHKIGAAQVNGDQIRKGRGQGATN